MRSRQYFDRFALKSLQIQTSVLSVMFFLLFNWIANFLFGGRVTHTLLGHNIHSYLRKYNYTIENHTVITEDGYILGVHRVPCGRNFKKCDTSTRPPILFMHGFCGSSMDWVYIPPEKSLALLLADQGYDIWLANHRGNKWSRRHVYLDSATDSEYSDYSYHEVGYYDIPATVDYILNTTNTKNVTFVGLSQGVTSLLVMGSLRPEYNQKILLGCGLAPVTDLSNSRSPASQLLVKFHRIFEVLFKRLRINDIYEETLTFLKIGKLLAYSNINIFDYVLTKFIVGYFFGSSDSLDMEVLPFFFSQYPAGCSVKQFFHYAQSTEYGFAQYDYGNVTNVQKYNQTIPPKYDLSKVTMPLALYYSAADSFLDKTVFNETLEKLPNVVQVYPVPAKPFDHLDFMLNKNLVPLLYNQVIETIKKYSYIHQ